jgi:hypothetical protein
MLDAIKEWGVKGDGEADNTDPFLRMREAFLSDRDRMWEVEFRPGRYLTRAPHWLDGVGRIRLIGPGATLQMPRPELGLFSLSEPFRTQIWTPPFDSTPIIRHHAGWRIASVAASAREVAFLEAPSALAPGAIVFIAGRAQQFQNLHLSEDKWQLNGWPPNLRYFEFARVLTFDGGVLMLDRPLTHTYDQNWRDYPGDYFGAYMAGAPRLYLCKRPGYDIPLHIEFQGFNFARSRGATVGCHVGLSLPALELVLENCTFLDDDGSFGATFIQIADRVTLRRCRLGDLEIDKCLHRVLIDDCDIAGLTSDGAGALEVEVLRSRIYGDCRINPRTSVTIDSATAFSNFSLNPQHGGYFDTEPFRMTMRAARS